MGLQLWFVCVCVCVCSIAMTLSFFRSMYLYTHISTALSLDLFEHGLVYSMNLTMFIFPCRSLIFLKFAVFDGTFAAAATTAVVVPLSPGVQPGAHCTSLLLSPTSRVLSPCFRAPFPLLTSFPRNFHLAAGTLSCHTAGPTM